uniref:Uncharacterized protein n=1 Tax=Lepeophtheirus salmonis TaxID=72036 RepID=A0A0K2UI13_LEPSM
MYFCFSNQFKTYIRCLSPKRKKL